MTNKFEIVRPKSLIDDNYSEYEYLIRWIGRDGSDYVYMFYDAEMRRKIDSNVINSETEVPESLITKIGRTITLSAVDLTENDYIILSGIIESKQVQRIKKDGTFEYYAPQSNSLTYRLMDGRYNITLRLSMSDKKQWK